ncbi:MAG TPA: NADP-dependent isocitrate dehydrogenase [Patescibacteria group bacterium]|nr:NADP-dependent isocitrate dehydrogenase [Patescibacteria group bacterium]
MKIFVKQPLVEIDGDEMTRVMWDMIKKELILPYLDMKLKYFDLGIENRDRTDDQVTIDAAQAIKEHGVGVKCATITPNQERVKEYRLKQEWKSPNGTIRALLDGTVFRKPIVIANIPPMVRSWVKPITIARHAYGDIYKNSEMTVDSGRTEFLVTASDGTQKRQLIHEFATSGVIQGIHNTDDSIRSFARACIQYAIGEKSDLWFSTKDTISKTYHARFRDIFNEEVSQNTEAMKRAGVEYFYTLIDDAVARIMRHSGGIIWACMNYDGDVMSDMLAAGYGSLALMTSVLVSPNGCYEYEAAHGTVQRHYSKHLKGEATSTNSIATIFAWTGALRKIGEREKNNDLMRFSHLLELSVLESVEGGHMTADLAKITTAEHPTPLSTQEFISFVAGKLKKKRSP